MGFIIILWDKQLILQTGTGFCVFISQQLKLWRDLGDHSLKLGIAGFIRTTITTAHTASSTTGTAIATAPARGFGKSSADSTEERKSKNH